MLKKCDANCDASVAHLWLRNNIFYYRVELPRVNGKRRYKRISLHTDNFFEAREKLRTMTTDKNWPFDELRRLFNSLIFEQGDNRGNIDMLSPFQMQKRLSKRNKPEDISQLYVLGTLAKQSNQMSLNPEDRALIKKFIKMQPIKHLKNEASERIVPIHQQLLDLGFVDYVQRRQKKLNAKGTDFIFPRCQSKSGEYNNKYTTRVIFNYLQDIGVKSGTKDCYDFHSFRKNANIAMQNAGLIATYINDIIGWEGKTTMEQSYSTILYSR